MFRGSWLISLRYIYSDLHTKRRFEEYHVASIAHIHPPSFLISAFVSDCKTQDKDNLNWLIEVAYIYINNRVNSLEKIAYDRMVRQDDGIAHGDRDHILFVRLTAAPARSCQSRRSVIFDLFFFLALSEPQKVQIKIHYLHYMDACISRWSHAYKTYFSLQKSLGYFPTQPSKRAA